MREWISGMGMPLSITDLLGCKLDEDDIEILANHPAYQLSDLHEANVSFSRGQTADFYRVLL